MRSNRRRDTKPELKIRRRLHASGFRYRVDFRLESDLRVNADIVFTRARVAVFIDGCFWHGCPLHATTPKTNSQYWIPKLARNAERDRTSEAALRQKGWLVLRYWEHQDPEEVADSIAAVVRRTAEERHSADASSRNRTAKSAGQRVTAYEADRD